MTTSAMRNLPSDLDGFEEDIAKALATPLLMTWDKAQPYREASQPMAVGDVVRALHPDIADARIGYIFREKIQKRDRTILATASKVGGKLGYFSSLDLLIEVNWQAWKRLDPRQRLALIDHELSHFGTEEDEETGDEKFVLVSHDVEEFSGIVQRWGLWKSDVVRFARVILSVQGDLFVQPDTEGA